MNDKINASNFRLLMHRLLPLLACICVAGCVTGETTLDDLPDEPVAVAVEADDPEMAAAIAQARATLPQFIQQRQGSADGDAYRYAIKGRFKGGEGIEYMWVSPFLYDADHQVFAGILKSQPRDPNLGHAGAQVLVPQRAVIDHMYLRRDDTIEGGTTDALLRARR